MDKTKIMELSVQAEEKFRTAYKNAAINLHQQILERCDVVIEVMKERGDLKSFSSLEHFSQFGIDSMLHFAVKLSKNHKGQYAALHTSKDILGL